MTEDQLKMFSDEDHSTNVPVEQYCGGLSQYQELFPNGLYDPECSLMWAEYREHRMAMNNWNMADGMIRDGELL